MARNLQQTLWIVIVLAALAGMALFFKMSGGSLVHLSAGLLPDLSDQRLFTQAAGINSQDDARELYRQALAELERKDFGPAQVKFEQLEAAYPGLLELVLLHEAEAFAGLGDELNAQKQLKELVEKRPRSPLVAKALYQLGQSHFRAGEPEQAKQQFERVRREYADSDYAKGSLYYLGQLSETANPAQAADYWQTYLEQCPDCLFSVSSAQALEKQLGKELAPRQAELIGLAYAHQGAEPKKAVAYLQQAGGSETWLELGKAQLEAGQTAAGVATLKAGLPTAKDKEMLQEAADAMLKHVPSGQVALLQQLAALSLPDGGDYVYWRLAQASPAQARQAYQRIVQAYPYGDYAPESSWNLLWPSLRDGQLSTFLTNAKTHLEKYPYSRSAPKVMFWVGKVQERQDPTQASRTYQNIVETYPSSYYAFRASGRLEKLLHGGSDPGWRTQNARQSYPPAYRLGEIQTAPSEAAFEQVAPGLSGRLRQAVVELQSIGAPGDVELVLKESLGEIPGPAESWIAHARGDHPVGIRKIRDAIAERSQPNQPLPAPPTAEELKLLYPVLYDALIAKFAAKNGIDPFLVQSLMREESYFNPLAVSGSNARGLMQLLPSTAHEVSEWEGWSSFQDFALFQPDSNIQLGTRYLRYLHQTFNGNSMPAVGAYNGGPNAMKGWISRSPAFSADPDFFVETIPYEQTRDYIKKVFESYWNYTRLYGA